MPIEIKELHIKAVVNQPGSSQEKQTAGTAPVSDDDKNNLIQQCIEQIMEIFANKKER
jgi:hypothetical protein